MAVSKVLAAALVTVGMISSSSASASESYSEINEDPVVAQAQDELDYSQGDTATVTDMSGNQHFISCRELTPGGSMQDASDEDSQNMAFYNHWSPYENVYYRCGSSYIRNQQIAWYHYRGTVHASGEYASGGSCGGSGRVVAASVTYKRDNRVLAHARAGVGETKTASAWDTLGSDHAKTQLFFDFTLV